MYERIASNKRRSVILFVLFVAFIIFLGWVFGEITGFPWIGLAIAAGIAFAMAWGSYYYSGKIVLAISKARPLKRSEYPFYYHTVEGLAIAAGIPTPKAYVIDDPAPNAFATGRNPQHAVVAATTGLLDKLNRVELEGVIAHELSHIKNYDILIMTLATVMVGTIVLLSDFILRTLWWGGGRRRRSSSSSSGGGAAYAIILLVGLIAAILAPIAAQLIRLAVSRKREYLADADGALLTRYPEGLASALEKIAKDPLPLKSANKATAHMWVYNPLREHKSKLNNLFRTHPPVEQRIKALREM